MNSNYSVTPLSENDYEAIEDAVMETGRGRWFLSEYAKRNRNSDTSVLLEAISKLEKNLGGARGSLEIERVRSDLMDMATTIAQLKIELASDNPDQNSFEQATEALDAVVQTTESATSSILEAAEQIQEMAWTLRETGTDISICDALDQRSADIYTACSFQDLTAQRTKKVVQTMRSIEGRINGLVDAWNAGEKTEQTTGSASELVQEQPSEMSLLLPSANSRRHLYTPVRIGQHLSVDDIDLVMREDEGQIIEHDALQAHKPVNHKFALKQEAPVPERSAPSEHDVIESEDLIYIERAPRPQHEAALPEPSDKNHTSLAEIDAASTQAKIKLFS